MNNLMKPSTMLSDKAELIELSKDSILHTGFKFIDLSILSNVFFYGRVQVSCQQTPLRFSTMKTKQKNLEDLCISNAETVNLSVAFILPFRLRAVKDNRSRRMETMEINVRIVYSFQSIGVGHTS